MAAFAIRLFGAVEVLQNGMPIPPTRTFKARGLLALLALRKEAPVERSYLARQLWPESALDFQAQYNLRRCLVELRDALGTEAGRIQTPTRSELKLVLEGASVDALEFDALTGRRQSRSGLEQAVALYRRPLLETWTQSWAEQERVPRTESFLAALEALAQEDRRYGRWAEAAGWLRRAVSLHPEREHFHGLLMQTLADQGDRTGVIHVYRELRTYLRDTINEEPSREIRALYQRLTQESPNPSPMVVVPLPSKAMHPPAESVGGAMLLSSPYYVVRESDRKVTASLQRGDGLILLKGARQTGKSSLLAREMAAARARGSRVFFTDFQSVVGSLTSTDALLFAVTQQLAHRLEAGVNWDPESPPGENLESFLTRALHSEEAAPVVWVMDGLDILFNTPIGGEVFALIRSWYNARAMEPDRVWGRIVLVLGYATEAHLCIPDLNQSPFNVGTPFLLEDFQLEQVADLNERHGSPLRGERNLQRLYAVVGGHPFLTQCALTALASETYTLEDVERAANRDDETIFSQHLNRVSQVLQADLEMTAAIRAFATKKTPPSHNAFYRLRSAGILIGSTPQTAQFRCGLYAAFLPRHLDDTSP